ncbi:MAG: hypothetical protein DRN20_02515 [Thermoplasmata archaeon]|mgnify:CR=1 FL=1|nr:MAG: hypothetical protein DRN20_02515 [Thermoplasmata archaeon]
MDNSKFYLCSAVLLASSYLSLYGSLRHSHWIIWAIGIVIALGIIYVFYPHSWRYVINYSLIYSSSYSSILFIFLLAERHKLFILLGALSAIFSIYVAIKTLQEVVIKRNEVSDIQYISTGLWSLSLLLFIIFSASSAYSWVKWALAASPITPYIVFEGILIALIPYMLYIPEKILSLYHPDALIAEMLINCPNCGVPLITVQGTCPHCGAKRDFYYCDSGEEHFVKCPYCSGITNANAQKCEHCGEKLEILCKVCGRRATASEYLRTAQ